MKTALLLSVLFCVIAMPVVSETPENTVETDIAVIKTEIKNLNSKMDDKFKAVDDKFKAVDDKFEDLGKRLDKRFESIEKNFDRQNNIIIACIGIPLAMLAIGATVWGILANRRNLKDTTQQKEIDMLKQEIETLKQQRAVNPSLDSS